MLDQFRHDMSNDSHDALQDSRFQMSRRKFVYTLSGAALALVLFLFLIGAFRSDKDEPLVSASGSGSSESTLADLQARVSKLEEVVMKQPGSTTPIAQVSSLPNDDLTAALTDDTLKQLIDQQQTADTLAYAITDPVMPEPSKTDEIQPIQTPKPAPKAAAPRTYVVQKGDTLSKISQRFYGSSKRWKEIYDANRDRISNINNLKVGTKIVIPEDTK